MASKFNRIDQLNKWFNLYRPWIFINEKARNNSKNFLKKNQFNFTLSTFNILSDDYLKNNDKLYSFCPPHTLRFPDRARRVLNEIQINNPDILCLQEVFSDHYTKFYSPELKKKGYEEIFSLRDTRSDGCAIFYKADKFKLLKSKSINFQRKDLSKSLDRPNIGLIAILEPKSNEESKLDNRLVVGTTHILFNPKRGDIKLAQIRLLFAEISELAFKKFDKDGKKMYYPFIMAADFNLYPGSPLYKFITEGKLKWKSEDRNTLSGHFSSNALRSKTYLYEDSININTISSNTEFINNNEENKIMNSEDQNNEDNQKICDKKINNSINDTISHNLKLKSVFRSRDNFKQKLITAKNDRSIEMVDYIFYSHTEELDVVGLRKLCNEEFIYKNVPYMPNEFLGSDHFSLIAKFSLYNQIEK